MSTSLPESAEPKLIDIWLCGHVGILFLVFFVHIIVSLAQEQDEEDECDQNRVMKIKNNNDGEKKWAMMKTFLDLVSKLNTVDSVYKWRLPSLSELTPMIFEMGLTHLGPEAYKYHLLSGFATNCVTQVLL